MTHINFADYVNRIGVGEISWASKEEIVTSFMPAAVVGLSDGDFVGLHEPYVGQQAELYGQHHYAQGKVARAVLAASLANGLDPGDVYDFQRFAANYFVQPTSPFAQNKADSIVKIHPEVITIDGEPLALRSEPNFVIDYGACLTGRSFIADQMKFVRRKKRPFVPADSAWPTPKTDA